MTGWLIDINPRECPPDVMDTPEAYRAAWGRYVGEAVPGDGDPEDWREQAARLEAATRILPDPHLTLPTAEAGGFLFHRPVAFESVKGLQGLRKRLVRTCPTLPFVQLCVMRLVRVG